MMKYGLKQRESMVCRKIINPVRAPEDICLSIIILDHINGRYIDGTCTPQILVIMHKTDIFFAGSQKLPITVKQRIYNQKKIRIQNLTLDGKTHHIFWLSCKKVGRPWRRRDALRSLEAYT